MPEERKFLENYSENVSKEMYCRRIHYNGKNLI